MRTLIILHLLVLAGIVTSLSGQATKAAPAYIRPPVPKELGEFSISLRYTPAPSIRFGNLGNIDIQDPIFRDLFQPPINDPEGRTASEKVAIFNDGFVIAGYTDSPNNPNTGTATGYFVYLGDSSTTGVSNVSADRTKLLLHQYGTTGGAGIFYEADVSDNMGWEIAYTRFLSEKRKFGIDFGFSFDGFNTSYDDTVQRNLLSQEWLYQASGGKRIPYNFQIKKNADGSIKYIAIIPSANTTINGDGAVVDVDPIGGTEQDPEVVTGGIVDVKETLLFRSAMYNFRVGPTYRLKLGDSFALSLGIGLMVRYLDVEFASTEQLVIHDQSGLYDEVTIGKIESVADDYDPEGEGKVINRKTLTQEGSWVVGAYVDASARYLFTDRMSLFSGLQYQTGSTYSQTAGSAKVDMDLDLISIKTGFGIKF